MKKLTLIAALVSLFYTTDLLAWGRQGHATIAYIAEQHMTKAAKKNLDKWMNGRSIVYYASHMDDYKPQMLVDLGYDPTDAPRMHKLPHTFEVDAAGEPLHGVSYSDGKYLGNCLYFIEQSADRLKNHITELDDSTRMACIQVIVHSVGDMHCLSHVRYPDNKTIGYYNVKFNGVPTRYHSIFDTPILQSPHPWSFSDLAYVLDCYSPAQQKQMTAGDLYDWARDSAATARCIYDVKEDEEFGSDCMKRYKPIAEEQLAKAGYRLAKMLNDIFGK